MKNTKCTQVIAIRLRSLVTLFDCTIDAHLACEMLKSYWLPVVSALVTRLLENGARNLVSVTENSFLSR